MESGVGFVLVKPSVHFEDLFLEIEPSDLGIQTTNVSIPPIRFNLLSDEILDKIHELRQKVFDDIAETAILIQWEEDGINIYFEDSISLYGFPKNREEQGAVRFNDYLYLMTGKFYEDFYNRFDEYDDEFYELLGEIEDTYDEMIETAFDKIVSDFPSVKPIESKLMQGVTTKDEFINQSKIELGYADIWLNEHDAIIQGCLREAYKTGEAMASNLRRRKNPEVFEKLKNLIKRAIYRIEKYNVTDDNHILKIIENLKKLDAIYNNNARAKKLYDEEQLLKEIDDIYNNHFLYNK